MKEIICVSCWNLFTADTGASESVVCVHCGAAQQSNVDLDQIDTLGALDIADTIPAAPASENEVDNQEQPEAEEETPEDEPQASLETTEAPAESEATAAEEIESTEVDSTVATQSTEEEDASEAPLHEEEDASDTDVAAENEDDESAEPEEDSVEPTEDDDGSGGSEGEASDDSESQEASANSLQEAVPEEEGAESPEEPEGSDGENPLVEAFEDAGGVDFELSSREKSDDEANEEAPEFNEDDFVEAVAELSSSTEDEEPASASTENERPWQVKLKSGLVFSFPSIEMVKKWAKDKDHTQLSIAHGEDDFQILHDFLESFEEEKLSQATKSHATDGTSSQAGDGSTDTFEPDDGLSPAARAAAKRRAEGKTANITSEYRFRMEDASSGSGKKWLWILLGTLMLGGGAVGVLIWQGIIQL